jgi:serine/threonine-protein kinase
MGEVYRAHDEQLNRAVAIKFLSSQIESESSQRRFQQEARFASALNHPHIITVHEVGEFRGKPYIVTEFIDGGTAREWARRNHPDWREIIDLLIGVADGLACAHEAGILHRDIKPDNILITKSGYAKLSDFGLAKQVFATEVNASEAQTISRTEPGIMLGTIAYMSPEQASGKVPDAQTDIFAFGIVLYELLAGRRPFDGANPLEVLQRIIQANPKPLDEMLPPKLWTIVKKALEKNPAERYQSMREMFADLRRVVRQPEATSDSEKAYDPVLVSSDKTPSKYDSQTEMRSLAVLPFVNESSDSEMEYLSDGLTESIIHSLSQLTKLSVLSRNAVFRFKGKTEDVQSVGKTLNAQAVLSGRVLKRGETLLINVELIDVLNGWQLWGDRYRKKITDIFTIEEDIAREISEKLKVKITPNLQPRRYTDDVEAYHLYLKGKFFWGKRTEDGLRKAIGYFREAIERDPTYALAYAGMAEAYVPLGVYCHLAPRDAFPKAISAAQKAIEIDSQLSEARTVVGAVRSYFDWDLIRGEKELREAIELDPKYARARQALSECLIMKGEITEALKEIKIARALDPLSLHLNAAVTMNYYFARKYDEAIENGRRTVELDSNFFPGYFYMGLACIQKGQYQEAADILQQATLLSGNITLMLASLGSVFAFWGNQREAEKILVDLINMGQQKYVSQVFVAAIHAGLGQPDQALICLERASQDRCYWLPGALAADPRLDTLRNEPRFQELCKRVGLRLTDNARN